MIILETDKNAKDGLSVIIPCYDSNIEWLVDCLHSVLNALKGVQGFLEIIVVDDGSEVPLFSMLDSSPRLVKMELIRVIRKSNGGLSSARNEGIKRSKGRWCHFIDDDDLVAESFYVELLPLLTKSSSSFAYCDSEFFNENTRFPFVTPSPNEFSARMIIGNCIHVNSVIIETRLLEKLGGFDESLNGLEDWDMWLRCLRDGMTIQHVPKVLVSVRLRGGSMSTNRNRMYSRMTELSLREWNANSDFWFRVLQNRKNIENWVKATLTYAFRSENILNAIIAAIQAMKSRVGLLRLVLLVSRQTLRAIWVKDNSEHSRL